jgi:hypothetical protein
MYELAVYRLTAPNLFRDIIQAVAIVRYFGRTEKFTKDGLWNESTILKNPRGRDRVVFAFSQEKGRGWYKRIPWMEVQNQDTPRRYESIALVEFKIVDRQLVYIWNEKYPFDEVFVWIDGKEAKLELV